jgi:dTDP-4-amino-4,6-dideoxygalactose transaminase
MSVPDTVRHGSKTVVFEEYPELGFNYRMTDIQAAVGRVQLGRLPDLLPRRVELAANYTRALRDIRGLEAPFVPETMRPNYQSYAVRVTRDYRRTRDELMQALLDRNISTRRGIMNAHQEAAYAAAASQALPHSEAARDGVVLLPLYGGMTDAEQHRVIEALAE